jgi:hypothetical protein
MFPFKLHSLLEDAAREDLEHIVSWLPDGKAFHIHKPKDFAVYALPRHFDQTKYKAFTRQLNIYGFQRLKDRQSDVFGAYSHKLFI